MMKVDASRVARSRHWILNPKTQKAGRQKWTYLDLQSRRSKTWAHLFRWNGTRLLLVAALYKAACHPKPTFRSSCYSGHCNYCHQQVERGLCASPQQPLSQRTTHTSVHGGKKKLFSHCWLKWLCTASGFHFWAYGFTDANNVFLKSTRDWLKKINCQEKLEINFIVLLNESPLQAEPSASPHLWASALSHGERGKEPPGLGTSPQRWES